MKSLLSILSVKMPIYIGKTTNTRITNRFNFVYESTITNQHGKRQEYVRSRHGSVLLHLSLGVRLYPTLLL